MAFPDNPILKKSFNTFSGDWTYEIYDQQDDPGAGNHKELEIIKSEGLNQIAGSSSFDPKKHIHPTQELFSILDRDDYLYNKLKNESSSRFRLDVIKDVNLVNRFNILTEKVDKEKSNFDSALPLLSFDGLTNLKSEKFELTGYWTLFNLFENILGKVGHELQLIFMFDLKHNGADGTFLPRLARIPVEEILPDDNNRTNYKILEHVLSIFELHLSQVNGAWWIQQLNIKTGNCNTFTKGIPPGLEVDIESNYNPVVSLNDKISQGSDDTTHSIYSPVINTYNVKSDASGGTQNPLFDSWNGPVTIPNGWSLDNGTVSRVDANDGLRIDQSATPRILSQNQPRIYRGSDLINVDIEFIIYDNIEEFNVFSVEFAEIKLVDIQGGTNYYIVEDTGILITQTTQEYLKAEVNTAPGSDNYLVQLNQDVPIPVGFFGYLVVEINCDDHTFDPNNDLTNEFTRIDFNKFDVKFKADNPESDYVYTHSKDLQRKQLDFEPTIGDTLFENFDNAIQFLYDASNNTWLPSYSWNNSDSIIKRKSRLLLTNLSKPSSGLKYNIDADLVQIDLRNSLLSDGIYYNPFYIAWDKINNKYRTHLIELNNDLNSPTETLKVVEK